MRQMILALRILVDPVKVEKETKGGIIIPDNINKRPSSGIVVQRGNSSTEVEMEIKIGDHVVFPEGVGQEVEINGKSYLLMTQKDTLYHTRD